MRWLDSINDSMDMNLSKLQKIVEDRRAWHAAVHGVAKSWTWLNDWTTTTTATTAATTTTATVYHWYCWLPPLLSYIHNVLLKWKGCPLVLPQSSCVIEFADTYRVKIYTPFIIRNGGMLWFLNYLIHSLQKANRKETDVKPHFKILSMSNF